MSKEKRRVPKLRFPGFTEDWEQRKLSEVTTCFDNLRVAVTASDRVPGKIPYYGANGIQDYVSGHTHSGEFVLIAEDGANDLNDYPIQYVNGAIWVNNHAHVIAGYKEKLENNFLSYSLKTVKMTTFIVGGGRSKLNLKALLEIPISMPNYDEQCVIGEFIETIDKNITLHQRKLNNLKLKKKALFQKLFPKNGERYPELRFPGFTDAWEQCELEELCNIYDGTHQTPRYTNNGVMFVSVENIKTLESDKYISEDDFKSEFKISPEYGDILLTRIGDVGSANIILDNIKRAYYVSLALLKPKDISSLFLLALLASSSVQSEIWRRTLHIAFPKKINKNEIGKVIVNKPSIPEQKKIGELIYALDRTVTLHQRKLDHLQLQKKALLQQMFV